MSSLIFLLPAPNVYEKQGRVAGWKHTPTARESLKALKVLVPRLRELGVQRVVCSDLDAQSGDYLARKLGVPVEEWESLRRLNVGKLHGMKLYKFQELYETVQAQWRDNPTIPIRGGDSKTSFVRRMNAAAQRLASAQQQTLVIAPAPVIEALLGQEVAEVAPCRLYAGEVPLGQPA